MSRVPTQGIDYTNKDYDAFREMMIAQLGVKLPEYTDLSSSDAGIVILECLAQGLDIVSYYQDIMANECFLTSLKQRDNAQSWCNTLNFIPREASSSVFEQVFTMEEEQEEDVLIPMGTVVSTEEGVMEEALYFETIKDLIIPIGKLGNELDDEGNYIYSVLVVQGYTISGEILGSSSEAKNQSFIFGYSPVLVDSIKIQIDEGVGLEPWTRVDNFVDSKPTDKHYIIRVENNNDTVVIFGDGVFGKIPEYFDEGIYADYRVGGGTIGNVGARTITELGEDLAVIDSTFNPNKALVEGRDRATVDELKRFAPVAHRTYWGALTAEDFAELVKMNFPGEVLTANAKTDLTDTDNIYIWVLCEDNRPLSLDLKTRIHNLFDVDHGGRSIVGMQEYFIEDCKVTPLNLTCDLVVLPKYSKETVEAGVRAFLENFFAIGNYDFKQELSLPDLAMQVMSPENGILGIRSFYFTFNDDGIMTPDPDEIFTLDPNFSLNVTGGI